MAVSSNEGPRRRRRADPAIRSRASITTTHRRTHVALTGTSNSIFLNGVSHGLGKHPAVQKFLNKSQGASGTVAIASHLRNFDLTGFHYLFIEYCVNETIMLANGKERIENTFRHIAAMVDHAARHGCVPVLVNFPTLHSLGSKTPMLEMLEREFVARGVPLFDVQALLEGWARQRGLDVRPCFLDPLHLKRPIAYAIGAVMIDTIERARDAKAIAAWVDVTEADYGAIGFVAADTLVSSQARCIHRANRFLEATLLALRPGQTATIPASEPGRRRIIRGVAYNSARTLGRLIEEDGSTIIDVKRSRLFGTERDLALVNVPSPLPDIPHSEAVTFGYEGVEVIDGDGHPMAFELAGFIVHDPDVSHPLHVIAVAEEFRHLHETVTKADLAALDESWEEVSVSGVGFSTEIPPGGDL